VTSDALLIDFGGVLTTSVFGSFAAFCTRHGLPEDAVARCLREDPEGAGLLVALEKGELDDAAFEAGFAQRLAARTQAPVAADGLLAALTAALAPVPEMVDAVAALRARGVPTVLVSNAMGHASYELVDLDGLFDHVVLSTELGVRKPSRRMYAEAAERVGAAPERCLMVDDLEQNLVGAARIGMPGHLHVEPAGTLAALRAAFG
jgi:putative hydrolase of the HAD superfamily